MRILIASIFGASVFLAGCMDNSLETPKDNVENTLPPQSRTSGPSTHFLGYTETQSDGRSTVERFVDCGIDQIMTGFGGHVNGGDFVGVTAYCRDIQSDGTLGNESQVSSGTSGSESVKTVPFGYAVVGVGGWVGSGNLRRVTLTACKWNVSTRNLDMGSCQNFSSDGIWSHELFWDVHKNLTINDKAKTVATGAGMTASNDNVVQIRLTSGRLR